MASILLKTIYYYIIMALSVSEINEQVYTLLLSNYNKKISIKGEISNCKPSRNHIYFNLKDDNASISCVFWDYKKYIDIDLKDGQNVEVNGYIDFYRKIGNFQFRTTNITFNGIGNIKALYDKMFKEYKEKGYFDDKIKKSIPKNIENIGIITAKDGAALQDVLYALNRNKFNGNVYIKNGIVQGSECPQSICDGIKYFNNFKINNKHIDLLLITRGGGSFDDLIGFSSKQIIEEIFNSNLVIMSAIGHEVDWMISDYVADIRAPTPSIAGEMISEQQAKNIQQLDDHMHFINDVIKNRILNSFYEYETKILKYAKKLDECNNIINSKINYFDSLINNLKSTLYDNLHKHEEDIANAKINLSKANPNIGLDTGNIIVTNSKGTYIKDIMDVKDKGKLKIIFNNGIVEVSIKKIILNE